MPFVKEGLPVKRFYAVMLVVSLGVMVACGKNSPTSPSTGWDPSKPIDQNNRPPAPPPPIIPISAVVQVFREDCIKDLNSCSKEVMPDPSLEKVWDEYATYPVDNHMQMYTIRMRVVHQQWRERSLFANVGLPGSTGNSSPLMEGNTPSPYVIGGVFNLQIGNFGQITNTTTVSVSYSESSYDLFEPNNWRANLGFRYRP